MIPNAEECFDYMERYGMLDNIRDHSLVVEKVARLIASRLQKAWGEISIDKVTAGALMHDIGKTLCLNSRVDHAAKGREICLQNHLDEIAEIVGEHVILKDFDPDRSISEKEIIYYADKRVTHDEIVGLEQRLEYIIDRYGKENEKLGRLIRKNFDECREVEIKIFTMLDFRPEELAGIVHPVIS